MGKLVKSVTGSIFGGGGSSPGMLGTGKFKGNKFADFDKKPFEKQLEGTGRQESVRDQQAAQARSLQARTTSEAGKGETQKMIKAGADIAQGQLKASSERNLAQQLAAAQSARGGSAGARQRQLMKSQQAAGRDLNQQSAQLGKELSAQGLQAQIQENQNIQNRQLQAEQQLAAQLQAQRATDINLAEADRASAQKLQEILMNENLGVQGLNLSGFQSAAQQRAGLAQGVGGALAAFSDKNLKKSIKSHSSKDNNNNNKVPKENKESKTAKAASAFSSAMKDQPKTNDGVGNSMLQQAMSRISDENNKKEVEVESLEVKTPELKKPESSTIVKTPEPVKAPEEEKKESKMDMSKIAASLGPALESISDNNNKIEVEVESSSEKEPNMDDFSPRSFLDALKAYSYEYKNSHKGSDKGGEGRFLSPMAQDLEKAGPVGKSAVLNTPKGKIVDYGKLSGAMLASQAHLNERLSEMEKGFGAVIAAKKNMKFKKSK